MVEIVAKDKETFLSICEIYGIPLAKARFKQLAKALTVKRLRYVAPIWDLNVKRDGSDWIDYSTS